MIRINSRSSPSSPSSPSPSPSSYRNAKAHSFLSLVRACEVIQVLKRRVCVRYMQRESVLPVYHGRPLRQPFHLLPPSSPPLTLFLLLFLLILLILISSLILPILRLSPIGNLNNLAIPRPPVIKSTSQHALQSKLPRHPRRNEPSTQEMALHLPTTTALPCSTLETAYASFGRGEGDEDVGVEGEFGRWGGG